MTLAWFIVLMFWGLFAPEHFQEIPTVAWLLLIPMFAQDKYDVSHKRAWF